MQSTTAVSIGGGARFRVRRHRVHADVRLPEAIGWNLRGTPDGVDYGP